MGEPSKPRVRRPSNFRQQDISRAIRAAKGAGLDVARVEIDPVTKKITMVMRDSSSVTETANPLHTAPVDDPAVRRRKSKCHGSEN